MSSPKSGKFFVGSIVTFLILFGVLKIVLSTMQDIEKKAVTAESMSAEDITKRIEPVAKVNIGEVPVAAPALVVAAAPADAAATDDKGTKIVTQVCSMCHATGMMGAPKLGNKDDWAPRIAKGIDTLHSHALNGFNMMPAHGGRPDLSDDDIKAAVDHMVSLVK